MMGYSRDPVPASSSEPPASIPAGRGSARFISSKVPALTVWFWFAQLLSAGLGETAQGWSAGSLGAALTVALSVAGLALAMIVQFRAQRYRPWCYWTAVLTVSVLASSLVDVVGIEWDAPGALLTGTLSMALVAIFTLWSRVEGVLSTGSIQTPRRELFYWAAFVTMCLLGAAASELVASATLAGYSTSTIVFSVLFCLPVIAYHASFLSAVATSWTAHAFVRPLGASVAEWLAVPGQGVGAGVGSGLMSLALLAEFLLAVTYMALTRVGEPDVSGLISPV